MVLMFLKTLTLFTKTTNFSFWVLSRVPAARTALHALIVRIGRKPLKWVVDMGINEFFGIPTADGFKFWNSHAQKRSRTLGAL